MENTEIIETMNAHEATEWLRGWGVRTAGKA